MRVAATGTKGGCLEELAVVSLVHACFCWQLWGGGGFLKTELSCPSGNCLMQHVGAPHPI